MVNLEGKCAVVTGAAKGLGFAIAEKFIREKIDKIAVLDWDEERIVEAFEKLKAISPAAVVLPVRCNVSDAGSVTSAFDKIQGTLGNIDILVNNAGITRDAMLHKMTDEQWDVVIRVNLYSMYYCCKAVLPGMRERGYGRIVNISSTGAYGNVGQTNYSAAKAGVIGFTKSLAKESARKGITVNAIAPDFVNTEMMSAVPDSTMKMLLDRAPMQRMGEPHEIASVAAFLCSEEAGYVSGVCIDCSGGRT